jgi:hypothetical protein|nr:T9SS type A sorting domain-containing protein [Candidatus Krumholzibacteria bacterium]
MTKLRLNVLVCMAAVCLAATGVLAEDPVALIMEGQTVTGLPDGFVVDSINNPAVNHSGGWAFNTNVSNGGEAIGTIWGHTTGGPGMVLRQEGIFPPYEQLSFESFWGFGAGGASCYSPSCFNQDTGVSGLDGVWIDDIPVAVEEMVFADLPGYWFSFGSRPGVTEDGIPYFVGGITDTQGGSTQIRGLFYGMDASAKFLGGDLLPGLPFVLTGSGIGFDYRFSKFGTHYIAEVTMDTATASNNAMVFDGEGLLIDGQLVQEGTPVPEAAGGFPGENWSAFDYCSVTESGSYMFTGDTSNETTADEFVCIDGFILLREGKDIGEYIVNGSIEGAFMNEDGDYVVIWDVDLPTGENVEAMIFNGEVVLLEGDIVDTDGDGVPEPDATVTNFTGISSVVLSDRDAQGGVSIYFTADVEIAGVPGNDDRGLVVLASDELGLDEDITIDEGSRAEVEIGFRLTYGGVVSALLGEMECAVHADGVHIDWRLNSAEDAERLTLRGSSADRTWDVPFQVENGRVFSAIDHQAFGGEVLYTLLITGSDGAPRVLGEKAVRLETPALGVVLEGAYPNPFNPATKVSFRVGSDQRVQLAIYDLSGRLVVELADEVFTAGLNQVSWNGRDHRGASVPSGTYFARMISDQGMQSAKLMLVK